MDLTCLRDFHAVSRSGSFSEAARRTGVPKATVARRVARLEHEVGVRLFERGGRMLRLTNEGRTLEERTGALIDELDEIGVEMAESSGRPQGVLRISAPSLFADLHLGTLAAKFVARFPEVHLEVHVQDRLVDVHADRFDIVIRANPETDSRLVGRRLTVQPVHVVAAPGIARPVRSGTEVAVASLLTWPKSDEWSVIREEGDIVIHTRSVAAFSSLVPLRDALMAGIGAGMLPLNAARQPLADGSLVSWGLLGNRNAEVWALHTSARLPSARVRAFVAMLSDHLEDEAKRGVAAADRPGHAVSGVEGARTT